MKFTPLQGRFSGRIGPNCTGKAMARSGRRDTDAIATRHACDTDATGAGRGSVEGGVERVEDWRIAEDRPEKILHWKGVGWGRRLALRVWCRGGQSAFFDRCAGPPPADLQRGGFLVYPLTTKIGHTFSIADIHSPP